jgi:crotonobetainyl-CoA:carnitine CoA-transferase CaiB-like acyl-CoA transferase
MPQTQEKPLRKLRVVEISSSAPAAACGRHQLDHTDLGVHKNAGFPYVFQHSNLLAEQASARLGQHSRTLLCTALNLNDEEINRLFASGVSGENGNGSKQLKQLKPANNLKKIISNNDR